MDNRYAHQKCDYYRDHRLDSIGRNHVTGNLLGELVLLHAKNLVLAVPKSPGTERSSAAHAIQTSAVRNEYDSSLVRIPGGSGHYTGLWGVQC